MNRFKLLDGKFGFYYYDSQKNIDLSLIDVLELLNKPSIPISKLEELVENADASLWGFMESIQKLIDKTNETNS